MGIRYVAVIDLAQPCGGVDRRERTGRDARADRRAPGRRLLDARGFQRQAERIGEQLGQPRRVAAAAGDTDAIDGEGRRQRIDMDTMIEHHAFENRAQDMAATMPALQAEQARAGRLVVGRTVKKRVIDQARRAPERLVQRRLHVGEKGPGAAIAGPAPLAMKPFEIARRRR